MVKWTSDRRRENKKNDFRKKDGKLLNFTISSVTNLFFYISWRNSVKVVLRAQETGAKNLDRNSDIFLNTLCPKIL